MQNSISIDQYKTHIKKKKRHKYNAVPKIIDGIRFDSTAEGDYYEQLKLRVLVREVHYFLRQVPIRLPGGVQMIIDFMLVYPNKEIHYVDVKGVVTQAWRAKQRIVEALYPFKIEIVRSTHGKHRRRSQRTT